MHQSAAEWEVGTGHLSAATTLVRDTVLNSSNSNAAVNFSAGTKDVTSAYPFDFAVGQQTIWVSAAQMTPNATNGPSFGAAETTTNDVMYATYDFDTTTSESAQFAIQMPKSWDESTLIVQTVWSHPSTATNFGVVWEVAAVAFADGDALDTAFGTAVSMTDTGATTDDVYISPESSALTVAGSPSAEEYVIFKVSRAVANGSDTLAVDARLHGIKIHYTTDAGSDD